MAAVALVRTSASAASVPAVQPGITTTITARFAEATALAAAFAGPAAISAAATGALSTGSGSAIAGRADEIAHLEVLADV
jgi:hypothetical protein